MTGSLRTHLAILAAALLVLLLLALEARGQFFTLDWDRCYINAYDSAMVCPDSFRIWRNGKHIASVADSTWGDTDPLAVRRYYYLTALAQGYRESDPSNVVSGLYIDWSDGAEVVMVKIKEYDGHCIKVVLPWGPWSLDWVTMEPDSVVAWSDWDFNRDARCDLSDLSYFGQGYGSIWDLSDFASFGGLYNKPARLEWR